MESFQMTAEQWQQKSQLYKSELLTDLLQFLSIPSVLDKTTANVQQPFGAGIETALQFLVDMGRRDGFKVERVADNMVVVIDYGP